MNKLGWLLGLVWCELMGQPRIEEHERPRDHVVEVNLWCSYPDLSVSHEEVIHHLAWPGIGEDWE